VAPISNGRRVNPGERCDEQEAVERGCLGDKVRPEFDDGQVQTGSVGGTLGDPGKVGDQQSQCHPSWIDGCQETSGDGELGSDVREGVGHGCVQDAMGMAGVASRDQPNLVFWFADEGKACQVVGVAEKSKRNRWTLALRVVPNAPGTAVVGWETGELKVKVQAVPEDGKANRELIRFLAKTAGIPRSAITLQSGESSRHKRLVIEGVEEERFLERLGVALPEKRL
jgi:uncharacterized protein